MTGRVKFGCRHKLGLFSSRLSDRLKSSPSFLSGYEKLIRQAVSLPVFYLCVHGLFNNAVGSLDCIASNDRLFSE